MHTQNIQMEAQNTNIARFCIHDLNRNIYLIYMRPQDQKRPKFILLILKEKREGLATIK